ncbi:MAG: GIY-YIG nuclease family protein, partial [Chloroflexi bacterium]|nr:GIY-YIG nuclease family protein [Chloroflexota bacterium]
MREYYVYIMTNGARTLYIGVTNDLVRRVYEHKQKLIAGFTKKYNITFLVYHETTSSVEAARVRERQLKGWRRDRKIALIETFN